MAFVSDFYGLETPRGFNVSVPFGFKAIARVATIASAAVVAGGCVVATLGMLETVLPAFMPLAPVMRRLPAAMPHKLTVVDQTKGVGHAIRQGFIEAYTAGASYSNLDWHRNNANNADIIADVGADAVIEDAPIVATHVIEPREERVSPSSQVQFVLSPDMIVTATNTALSAFSDFTASSNAPKLVANAVPVPATSPVVKNSDFNVESGEQIALPDVVPFPENKPRKPAAENPKQPQLAYAPSNGKTEDIQRGLVQRLFGHTARNKTAIYDISAAIVYLPNGEKLEAHSGIGYMRDNPKYVDQKMRGATPPSTYNLRMRESLFHGVEAVRLLPANGRNPHNRDGLLAHTYMLRRPGDSNGCVVFKDYARFLRAFKKGEIDKMIVVESSSIISNKRYM